MLAAAQRAFPLLRVADTMRSQPIVRLFYRYGLSTSGPVAISAAHFAASVIFLRMLSAAEFGQFAFLLIVVPFCLGLSGALLGAPASLTRAKDEATASREIATLQKASLVVSGAAGLIVAALMLSTSAHTGEAVLFGLYGAGSVLRAFLRSLANVRGDIARAAASDILYATLLVVGLAGLIGFGRLTMPHAAVTLVLAILGSLVPFGWRHLRELLPSSGAPALLSYMPMWRDVTRWSLTGVVLTELTTNAHAYFVTFVSGPKVFGLLAIGALFMRPASLVLGALPDIDQPVMTRRIAQGDFKGAFRVVKEFRTAAGAVLVATIALSAAILIWFPGLLAKKGFDETQVLIVLAFWIAITAVRVLRTPEAVFLQATGNYSALARVSAWSGATSLLVTGFLLFAVGPVASLGGVLAGEVAVVLAIFPLTRAWKRAHA